MLTPSQSAILRLTAPPPRRAETWLRHRRGYSLLEIVLAVAILAGSGLVLQSMIGQGTRLGLQAEQRTLALELAQTLMNQRLASFKELGQQDHDQQGIFENSPEWGYQVTVEAVDSPSSPTGLQRRAELQRMIVEVFPANRLGSRSQLPMDRPTCRLIRWTRRSAASTSGPTNMESEQSAVDSWEKMP